MIAIGNGTASRETERLAAEVVAANPDLTLAKVTVSEAGASVYSASEIASRELPDLDVSHRGAASIARRLQDPLAELVKIDPKSIGVGQYQHDVSETKLSRQLSAVVEDAVNAVGVDVNTASPALLAQVSGLGASMADRIVAHRDANGPFRTRAALKKVQGLGPKTFELAAGFLRIQGGDDPLDASGVHPEAYPVVRRILQATKSDIRVLLGNSATLSQLSPEAFTDTRFGLPTVRDIIGELEKPAAIRARPSRRRVSRRASRPSATSAPACSSKAWSPTSRRSAPSWISASTRTASSTSPPWPAGASPRPPRWSGPARSSGCWCSASMSRASASACRCGSTTRSSRARSRGAPANRRPTRATRDRGRLRKRRGCPRRGPPARGGAVVPAQLSPGAKKKRPGRGPGRSDVDAADA